MTPGRNLTNGRLNITSIELDKDSLRIITLAQCRLFCDIWSSNMYSNMYSNVSSTTLYDFIWRNFSYWFFISNHLRTCTIAYVHELSSDRFNPQTLIAIWLVQFLLMNPKEFKKISLNGFMEEEWKKKKPLKDMQQKRYAALHWKCINLFTGSLS